MLYYSDALHLSPAPTEQLYDRQIRPIVRAAMTGYNGTCFAYGQTASGKTHTMMGSQTEPGVIPLAVDELFDFIRKVSAVASDCPEWSMSRADLFATNPQQNTTRSFTLRVSFLEIYNEQLRDLLPAPAAAGMAKQLKLTGEQGVVEGLEEREVSGPEEVLALLAEGDQRRRTGATDWNERSSRSHSVFMVTIESVKLGEGTARKSRLNLIDLAGSESATGQAERLKEGSFINKSLLTLGTVIGKLSEPKMSLGHIPYRDSKLTRLLQPALSGNSRVAVICTMSPDPEQATESLSTLKFARRAKMVVTKAERGVIMTDQMKIREYASQIDALKAQIEQNESIKAAREAQQERDTARAHAAEAEARSQQTATELGAASNELVRLRAELERVKSFVLTGPVVEANARRASGGFGVGMMSPMRNKRIASEMSGLGLGTPRGRAAGGSRVTSLAEHSEQDTLAKEQELALQLEAAQAKLAAFTATKDSEITTLASNLSAKEDELAALRAEMAALEASQVELSDLRVRVVEMEKSSAATSADASQVASASDEQEQRLAELERDLATARAALIVAEEAQAKVKADAEESVAQTKDKAKRLLKTKQDKIAETEAALIQANQALDKANAEVAHCTDEVAKVKVELEVVRAELAAARTELATVQVEVAEKSRLLNDALMQVAAAERQLAAKEAAGLLPDARDDRISSLEAEVHAVNVELEAIAAAKAAAAQDALDQLAAIKRERDAALTAARDAADELKQVEELKAHQAEEHSAAEQQLEREKAAALAAAQAEADELAERLRVKTEEAGALKRAVEQHEQNEANRNRYESNRRAGTDGLKDRLASLQARASSSQSTPVSASTKPSRRSTGQGRLSAGAELEGANELRERNQQLVNRVDELERQLVEAMGGPTSVHKPVTRTSTFDATAHKEVEDRLVVAEASASEWQNKFLATQRLLERLTAAQEVGAFTTKSENTPPSLSISPRRPSLAPISLSANTSPSKSTERFSTRPRIPSGSARHAATRALARASTPAQPSPARHTHSHSHSPQKPPPIPYSPQMNQRESEQQRKLRRETLGREMAMLTQSRGVERNLNAIESPQGSPRKAGWEWEEVGRGAGAPSPTVQERRARLGAW